MGKKSVFINALRLKSRWSQGDGSGMPAGRAAQRPWSRMANIGLDRVTEMAMHYEKNRDDRTKPTDGQDLRHARLGRVLRDPRLSPPQRCAVRMDRSGGWRRGGGRGPGAGRQR